MPGRWRPLRPSLGTEVQDGRKRRSGGVELWPTLHGEGAVTDERVFKNTDWAGAVGATTARERRILEGAAQVERNDWVQPQGLVHDVLQVLHRLHIVIGWALGGADGREYLVPDLAYNVGMPAELIKDQAQGAGCGVLFCRWSA